jgi:hypothetical protein
MFRSSRLMLPVPGTGSLWSSVILTSDFVKKKSLACFSGLFFAPGFSRGVPDS